MRLSILHMHLDSVPCAYTPDRVLDGFDQIHQALGQVYMHMERYQDAYAVLKDAFNETQAGTPRYYHLLNQVVALAMDLQDIDDVSTYIELILKDDKAPVDLFLHYVVVVESWYNYISAAALLQQTVIDHPRIKLHADYPKIAAHFGITNPTAAVVNQITPPLASKNSDDKLLKN